MTSDAVIFVSDNQVTVIPDVVNRILNDEVNDTLQCSFLADLFFSGLVSSTPDAVLLDFRSDVSAAK